MCTRPGYRVVDVPAPPRDRSESLDKAGYEAAVADWHQARAESSRRRSPQEPGAGRGRRVPGVGRPVGLRLAAAHHFDRVLSSGATEFEYTVIPGVTSVQALAAAHRIPLNRVGEPIHITPARRIEGGLPDGLDSAVVMLDRGFTAAGIAEALP